LETPVSKLFQTFLNFSKLFDPKTGFFDSETGFFDPKNRKLFPNLFPNYLCEIFAQFLQKFCEFEKTGYFRKISKLWKPNYSKTRENKKFGKFRLTQGLNLNCIFLDGCNFSISGYVLLHYDQMDQTSWISHHL